MTEELRQKKQLEANATSFVRSYFKNKSYTTQEAVKQAYLLIVRDKILL